MNRLIKIIILVLHICTFAQISKSLCLLFGVLSCFAYLCSLKPNIQNGRYKENDVS